MRACALIDGEHYPSVVRDTLRELPYEFIGAILVGGTEKLRGAEDYGVPLRDGFGDVDVVVDLSDEPVLGPVERMRWASRALAAGLPYIGADFRFDPPRFEPVDVPSIAVIGTGKRVGKTAVTGHLARLLARDRDVVVVAMGRGGPREPEVIETPPTVDELIPPVAADRRVLVVGAQQDADAYLNTYRRLISDLVVAVNCDVDGAIRASLRLRPVEPVEGRVAVFTAGGTDVGHLDAEVVHVSRNLANRDALREELERVDADTFLVEVKAAAIDVVAEHARAAGRRVVLAANDVVAPELDDALLTLAPIHVNQVPA